MGGILDAADVTYGVPRMFDELRRAGLVVNRNKVHRLIREHIRAPVPAAKAAHHLLGPRRL